MEKPQFSVRALLLTIAAVALVLALMLQAPTKGAIIALIALLVVSSALALTGVRAGRPFLSSYCVGSLVPMGIGILHLAGNLSVVIRMFADLPTFVDPEYPKFLGACLLASIAVGYICVVFRWLIDRPGSADENSQD